jgi:hypothetical protein
MNTLKNVPHKFDLTGLKAGQSFLGCPHCWFRINPGEAMKPVCPHCREQMLIYDVTPQDVKP